jgi:hypothetical protein
MPQEPKGPTTRQSVTGKPEDEDEKAPKAEQGKGKGKGDEWDPETGRDFTLEQRRNPAEVDEVEVKTKKVTGKGGTEVETTEEAAKKMHGFK